LQPGFVALALLLALDGFLVTPTALDLLEARLGAVGRAGFILRLDRKRAALESEPSEGLQVAVLGNSRAMAALDPDRFGSERTHLITRPGLEPLHRRVLAEEIAAARPDVAIVVWSELDTHRAVRLEPVVGHAIASVPALLDLVAATDGHFLLDNRKSLMRAGLASLLTGYRYREVLGEALGFRWRRFPIPARLAGPAPPPLAARAPIALFTGQPTPVSPGVRQQVRDLVPGGGDFVAVDQVDMISEISEGRHVEVQQRLLRRVVEILSRAGIRVLVVEPPMHPISAELYDVGTRLSFRRFIDELVESGLVHFVPVDSMPPFDADDFIDLIHLNLAGRSKLMEAVGPALDELAATPLRSDEAPD
jgi:hypothetical protein